MAQQTPVDRHRHALSYQRNQSPLVSHALLRDESDLTRKPLITSARHVAYKLSLMLSLGRQQCLNARFHVPGPASTRTGRQSANCVAQTSLSRDAFAAVEAT